MRRFVKNTPLLLTVVGLGFTAQSIAWEYVRVRPTYRFVIEPWSQRGYELRQGLVLAVGSVLVIVVVILLVAGVIKETRAHSAILGAALVAFGVGAAILTDAKAVTIPTALHVFLALIAGVVARSLLAPLLPEDWPKRTQRLAGLCIWLAGTLISYFAIIRPLLHSAHSFWLFMAVAGVMIASLSLFRAPSALANWRLVINAIVALWLLSMTMSASLRVGLKAAQIASSDISAELQDLQITSGVLLAWFGGLIAFSGAVGLWAKRRDEIAALERARKQQAAARESEAQLSVTG